MNPDMWIALGGAAAGAVLTGIGMTAVPKILATIRAPKGKAAFDAVKAKHAAPPVPTNVTPISSARRPGPGDDAA